MIKLFKNSVKPLQPEIYLHIYSYLYVYIYFIYIKY